jgi:iron-sulfur cluster repair protein YtfE (RIC family)
MWLMDWLHQHHTTEDVALWPLIRRQNPGAAALLDTMDAEHAAIGPAMEQVRSAARRYRDDDGDDARQALISALARLKEPLLTHLRDEEVEAMPVVSATITNAEWLDWDKKYNVKGKSLSRLGYEGHWLMDGLDPVRYQKLASLVPRPVFLVLRALYARPYRRACALRWGRSFQWAGRNPGQ